MHSKIVHNSGSNSPVQEDSGRLNAFVVVLWFSFTVRQSFLSSSHEPWTVKKRQEKITHGRNKIEQLQFCCCFFSLMIACRLLNIFGHHGFIISNEQHERSDDGATMMIECETKVFLWGKKLTAHLMQTHTFNDWYLISGCDFEAKFLEFYEIQRSICI